MADAFDIVIGVQNRREIEVLETNIDAAEKAINRLSEAFRLGTITQQQFEAAVKVEGASIDQARTKIESLKQENVKLGEATEQAGMSVRSLMRGMNQMTMGASGLMYTLPTIAQQLGASSELAMALGATTLAIVELGRHWEELQDIFGKTSGIEGAKSWLDALADTANGMNMTALGDMFSALAQGKATFAGKQEAIAELEKQAKEGAAVREGSRSEQQQERGKLFKKALGEYGGDRLFNELFSDMAAGRNLTPSQQDELKKQVNRRIAQGASGGVMGQGMDTFGKGFASEYRKQEGEVLNKEGEQGEKLFMHQWNAQTDLLNKEGEHGEKLWKEQMKKASYIPVRFLDWGYSL